MSDIITQVDKYKKGWTGGLPETACGSGSRLSKTIKQRKWIPYIIEKYNIKTISDIGAGDLNWVKKMDLSGVEYTPYDLVPRHPDVIEFDLIQHVPPKTDLILCLWVLNHLPFEHCQHAIKNIIDSGSKYLMMTDRPRYHADQPPEILMDAIEAMPLNDKGDSIRLIKL